MRFLNCNIRILLFILFTVSCIYSKDSSAKDYPGSKIAFFAGGCFWCVEASFEKVDGVHDVVSGYTDGEIKNPTYKQVSSGATKYIEAVKVIYDPQKVTYSELVDLFWSYFNPMDEGGSFYDRGHQYISGIFYQDKNEKKLAEKSKQALIKSGRYPDKIVTEIKPLKNWYDAEEYHQNYYLKKPDHYNRYRRGSGRDAFIAKYWSKKK